MLSKFGPSSQETRSRFVYNKYYVKVLPQLHFGSMAIYLTIPIVTGIPVT